MDRKRSYIEVYADILRVATDGAKKSHIVYQANLNFKIARKYLNRLREAGLLFGPTVESRLLRTTEKGIEYLKHYDSLKAFTSF